MKEIRYKFHFINFRDNTECISYENDTTDNHMVFTKLKVEITYEINLGKLSIVSGFHLSVCLCV